MVNRPWIAWGIALVLGWATAGCDSANGEPEPNACGDGVVDEGEACDDGSANSDTLAGACRSDCTLPGCGDGVVDEGEACDDAGQSGTCDDDCTAASCGDGRLNTAAGERCDTAGESFLCDADCTATACGDGVQNAAAGETCDDGNTQAGDGCNQECALEPGWACDTPGTACHPVGCGDGIVDAGEACDDGNRVGGDGCPADCAVVAPGWTCDAAGNACRRVFCGDGLVDAPEVCDDGNAKSGDGCTANCRATEAGFICERGGSPCRWIRCGDGFVDPPEECDDANLRAGDGCSRCTVDPGYACAEPGEPCRTIACGDGFVDPPEVCDDGNRTNGDGCGECDAIDARWACPIPGKACHVVTCGDNIIDAPETCDEGDAVPGDGCGPTCRLEGDSCDDAYDLNGLGDVGYGVYAWVGTTAPFTNDYDAPCAVTSGNPDVVARIAVPAAGDYDILAYAAFDAVLWAWDGTCGGDALLGCANDYGRGGEVLPAFGMTAGQTLYVGLDGVGASIENAGDFMLFLIPVTCGDGIVAPSESCDDGNTEAGDGCSPACVLDGDDCTAPFDLNALGQAGDGTWAFSGNTQRFRPSFAGASCAGTRQNGDAVARFAAPRTGNYQVTLDAAFDSVLWAWDSGCGAAAATELACQDAGTEREQAVLTLARGQAVYLVVDGWTGPALNEGPFDLTVVPLICGDGVLAPSEACDDGNTQPADGCAADCLAIDSGWACGAAGNACHPIVCGDGLVDAPEACDDGNAARADGCANDCAAIEGGWACDEPGAPCRPVVCGDGLLDAPELCDDGNLVPGDGCDDQCVSEGSGCPAAFDLTTQGATGYGGWVWIGDTTTLGADLDAPCADTAPSPDGVAEFVAPSAATYVFEADATFNSVLWVWEAPCDAAATLLTCDRGAGVGGASARVALAGGQTVYLAIDGESSFAPARGPFAVSVHAELCGDGILDPYEICDDGNTEASDGCSADCAAVDEGWECSVPGAACLRLCGNGVLDAGEVCDDGNTTPHDGCDTDCSMVDDGWACTTAGEACRPIICGDGVLDPPEVCDDGTAGGGDGCNLLCSAPEPGYACEVPGQPCTAVTCGDRRIDWTESCEDGNTASFDGCSERCQVEIGLPGSPVQLSGRIERGDKTWVRRSESCVPSLESGQLLDAFWIVNNTGAGQLLTLTASWAGDGFLHLFSPPFMPGALEQGCLVGNDDHGPGGLGSQIVDWPVARGETLVVVASTYAPHDAIGDYTIDLETAVLVCGDGRLDFGEACDDHNTTDSDGCSADCQLVEPGFICDLEGEPCLQVPGRLVINEIDYAMPAGVPETVEFAEIFNNTAGDIDLSGLRLVMVDASGVPYQDVALSGGAASPILAAGSYLLVHQPSVTVPPGVTSVPLPADADQITNKGPAGMAIVDPAAEAIIDAVSYDGSAIADLGFATGAVSLVEATPTAAVDPGAGSICRRMSNGRDVDDTAADWSQCTSSPGVENP